MTDHRPSDHRPLQSATTYRRDWLNEAMQIANGGQAKPKRGHIEALYNELQTLRSKHETLARLVKDVLADLQRRRQEQGAEPLSAAPGRLAEVLRG